VHLGLINGPFVPAPWSKYSTEKVKEEDNLGQEVEDRRNITF
jgi:hypothetical protein